MNIETLRDYCLAKRGVTEEFPFDDVTLVLKVAGKMFALIPLDTTELSISLKCDPERAIGLREQYPAIQAAWHFNKKHWNMVFLDGSLSEKFTQDLIDHSYELVVSGLTKKLREELLYT